MESSIDLISDMFDGSSFQIEDNDFDINDNITNNKFYYIDKADNILLRLNKDNYYHFLKTILTKFNILDINQKNDIISSLNIKPKEKIVYKDRIVTKTIYKKPKLNKDDY